MKRTQKLAADQSKVIELEGEPADVLWFYLALVSFPVSHSLFFLSCFRFLNSPLRTRLPISLSHCLIVLVSHRRAARLGGRAAAGLARHAALGPRLLQAVDERARQSHRHVR